MRLLKFDTVHPHDYLLKKQAEWKDELFSWDKETYYQKLISLRCNFSDFYTYNLNQLQWEAEEFFINDSIYIYKLAKELYGGAYKFKKLINLIKNKTGFIAPEWKLKVISDYIEAYKPDVIFCREHTNIPGYFWKKYKNKIFIISRISSHLPADWSPLEFNLIYTDLPHYREFFKYNKIDTLYNHNGFDERVLNELGSSEKLYDVVFVGGLNNHLFSSRTDFFAEIAGDANYKFNWWGYYDGDLDKVLINTYMGMAAGIEMFNIYRSSKIVINDYIDMAAGTAVNQRIYEVMGVGTLLLTRESPTIYDYFPEGSLVTYTSLEECKEKLNYYLNNESEREKIAKYGQSVILEKYNYKDLMKQLSGEITDRIGKIHD